MTSSSEAMKAMKILGQVLKQKKRQILKVVSECKILTMIASIGQFDGKFRLFCNKIAQKLLISQGNKIHLLVVCYLLFSPGNDRQK